MRLKFIPPANDPNILEGHVEWFVPRNAGHCIPRPTFIWLVPDGGNPVRELEQDAEDNEGKGDQGP